MQYWIIKTEPDTYSWQTFQHEGATHWNGVRNYLARNNMRAMKKGDLVFFYHSADERRILGIARVKKEAYPDHTSDDPTWCMVDVEYVKPLEKSVSLAQIKMVPDLKNMKLVKQGRLSVGPVTEAEFTIILGLAETSLS